MAGFFKLIKQQEMTGTELASCIGVSYDELVYWEKHGEPTPQQVKKLAYYLGVDKDTVYTALEHDTYRNDYHINREERARRYLRG